MFGLALKGNVRVKPKTKLANIEGSIAYFKQESLKNVREIAHATDTIRILSGKPQVVVAAKSKGD